MDGCLQQSEAVTHRQTHGYHRFPFPEIPLSRQKQQPENGGLIAKNGFQEWNLTQSQQTFKGSMKNAWTHPLQPNHRAPGSGLGAVKSFTSSGTLVFHVLLLRIRTCRSVGRMTHTKSILAIVPIFWAALPPFLPEVVFTKWPNIRRIVVYQKGG